MEYSVGIGRKKIPGEGRRKEWMLFLLRNVSSLLWSRFSLPVRGRHYACIYRFRVFPHHCWSVTGLVTCLLARVNSFTHCPDSFSHVAASLLRMVCFSSFFLSSEESIKVWWSRWTVMSTEPRFWFISEFVIDKPPFPCIVTVRHSGAFFFLISCDLFLQ